MLPIENLKYRRMADIPVGNLMYVPIGDDPASLAVRLDHPADAAGGQPYPAALILVSAAGEIRFPKVDRALRNHYCIDVGSCGAMVWSQPLETMPRSTREPILPGYLALTSYGPAISSFYAGGRGEVMYWSVSAGLPVSFDDQDFIFITQWRLGVTAADGQFQQLLEYPKDYRTPS